MSRKPQRGVSLITAIFLIVVLAVLGVAILLVASFQHGSSAIDVQGARLYQAARAGVEWGMFQVMDPANTVGGPVALPGCFATATFSPAGTFSGASTTVSCAVTSTTELDRNVNVYLITSTAKLGPVGTPNYVERQIAMSVGRCKDPSGTAPRYACP
jgi:MSHA biogenesis protein MshP